MAGVSGFGCRQGHDLRVRGLAAMVRLCQKRRRPQDRFGVASSGGALVCVFLTCMVYTNSPRGLLWGVFNGITCLCCLLSAGIQTQHSTFTVWWLKIGELPCAGTTSSRLSPSMHACCGSFGPCLGVCSKDVWVGLQMVA